MKPLTVLSAFSTSQLRPVYFASHTTSDETTVVVGLAGKFRSFADEAARTYTKPLDAAQFESIRHQALATFRERFAQQKHQSFTGPDDDILRSFGQVVVQPDGSVKTFAWGRFQFSSVQEGVGRSDLPTRLQPNQFIIGDAEGVGVTATVARNLAQRTDPTSLDGAIGSLADPFMLITVAAPTVPATATIVPDPVPTAGPDVFVPAPAPAELTPEPVEPVAAPLNEAEPIPTMSQPSLPEPDTAPEPAVPAEPIRNVPEPVRYYEEPVPYVPEPVVPTPPKPRPAARGPVQRGPAPAQSSPWKAMALLLLGILVAGGVIGTYYYWKQGRARTIARVDPPNPATSVATDEAGALPDTSAVFDDDQLADSLSTVLGDSVASDEPTTDAPTVSQAEQLFQLYQSQPDSLGYLLQAADQVDNVSDPDRQQQLRAEIGRERSYRFTEQTKVGRNAHDRAVLNLLVGQREKATENLEKARRAYELALRLQPDRADEVQPRLEKVRRKLDSLEE